MSGRPLKKLRLDSAGSSCARPENETRCCQLWPLLRRFAAIEHSLTNGKELETILRETISVLESSKSIVNPSSLRKMHGTLLLNLGFLSSLRVEDARLGALCIATSCMLCLYQFNIIEQFPENSHTAPSSIHIVLEPEEAEEAYSMVLQVMEGLSILPAPVSKNASQSQNICLQLVDQLLLQNTKVRETLGRNRQRLESLLCAVLRVSFEQLHSQPWQCEQGIEERKFRVLLTVQNISCTTARLVKIANLACSEGGDRQNIRLCCSSKEDLVFYLKCLSHGVSSRARVKETVFERLLIIAQEKSIACGNEEVMECLCQMIKRWGIGDNCDRILSKVVDIILSNAHVDETSVRSSVTCLRILTRRAELCETLQAQNGFNKLCQFLIAVAVSQSRGKEVAIEASETLLAIASSTNRCSELNEAVKAVKFRHFELVQYLVRAETQQVVERAVKFLGTMFRNELQRDQKVNFDYPNLFYGLAQASLHQFSSEKTKDHVIEIFRFAAETDTKARNLLAREEKVLESIVRAAAASRAEKSRESAVFTIMKISTNTCNHRIIARYPGLLPSLIRYTRTMSRSKGSHIQARESVKKRIFSLVEAL